ncbi:MAG: hypothetical protein ACTHML_06255 [Ginsengibacter sp.]
MRRLLLVLLFITPFISKAQIKDTSFAQIDAKFQKASEEMVKFDRQFKSGVILEIVGGLAASFGASRNVQPMTISGLVLTFFGFIINVSSSDHIRRAGLILSGNKLVIPLHRYK